MHHTSRVPWHEHKKYCEICSGWLLAAAKIHNEKAKNKSKLKSRKK